MVSCKSSALLCSGIWHLVTTQPLLLHFQQLPVCDTDWGVYLLFLAAFKILGCVSTADGAGAVGPKPLVDALGVKLVRTGQHSQDLACLEVAHAHNAGRLVPGVGFRVELVAGQLVDLGSRKATWFRLAQAFRQA